MNRILFVDDEPGILEGLRDVFRGERARWDMAFAQRPEQALVELDRQPTQVLVTDLRMPSMDGLALLGEVRARHPDVTRIVLSGQADLLLASRASALAHRYLIKPCSATVIRTHVDRALELRALVTGDTLRAAIGELGTVPSTPARYAELTAALQAPEADLALLAQVVKRDVGLAARVLQFANSAYCGLSGHVSSIESAILRLGFNTLRHLALTMEVFAGMGASLPEVEALERHSLRTAAIARRLMARPGDQDRAFTAGLLHDAGALVLLRRAPAAYAAARRWARETGQACAAAEREQLGTSHAQIGAYLLWLWDLPHELVEPVLFHHDPRRLVGDSLDVGAAVALASVLEHELSGDPPDPGAAEILRRLCGGCDLGRCRELARTVCADLAADASLTGWRPPSARRPAEGPRTS